MFEVAFDLELVLEKDQNIAALSLTCATDFDLIVQLLLEVIVTTLNDNA